MKQNKAFTLVEVLIAVLILGLFTSFLLVSNNTLVNSINHGVRSNYASNQALIINRAIKTLADESNSILVTPLIDNSANGMYTQNWVTGMGSNNVNLGLDKLLVDLTFDDLVAADKFLYDNRPSYGGSTLSMNRYYYDANLVKKGYMVWFNTIASNGYAYLRAVLEIRLLGNSSYNGPRNVYSGTDLPRTQNNSDSIRVTLWVVAGDPTGSDLLLADRMGRLAVGQGILNGLTPNNNYFGFKGSRIGIDSNYNSTYEKTLDTLFSASALVPLASYVVDYRTTSNLAYKDGVASDPPAEFALYHSVKLVDKDTGALTIKLPHPYDLEAVKVPKTFGVVTSLNASQTPLATSQDLKIENASILTIYPYFYDL